ncbi:TAXI family TRAP transporter solute-binding subunit [uncultured Sneathiella sp.]|uniref:TAXI family TRAP transporter solute-binding subunit n=1 Tax=uncultured Sneathiella sp. TaxID=879315 RepID=UPI0030EB4D06|tara:strand:+ start:26385 stop:27377 length:993 start_codon:yes stop_codon:yes gene_type:complete
MKLLKHIFASSAILLTLAVSSAHADDNPINIPSGPFGTGSNALSGAMEQISKKTDAKVKVVAAESPGLVFNLKQLKADPGSKPETLTPYTSGLAYLAENGLKPFDEPTPAPKLMATYLLGSVWLATLDENIKEPKDLVGKRVGLGRPPQILWTIEPELIIKHGWGLDGQIDIEYLGTKQAAQALLDGTVDAAIIGGYADPINKTFKASPQTLTVVGSGKTLYHIPWGEEAVEKTIAAGVGINKITIPEGAIDGVTADMPGFFDPIAWGAYPEMPEETAYQITKMIIENVGTFKEYHALGQLMSRESLAYGVDPSKIHPGALRAYKEAGLK